MPETRKRVYIPDSSVLVQNLPIVITSFHEHDVCMPMAVIEELDGFKKGDDLLARNARAINRFLKELAQKYVGLTSIPLPRPATGNLYFTDCPKTKKGKNGFKHLSNDDKIIAIACEINKHGRAIILSNDNVLAIKAAARGVRVEELKSETIPDREIYTGISEIKTTSPLRFDRDQNAYACPPEFDPTEHFPNECVVISVEDGKTHLAIYDACLKVLRRVTLRKKDERKGSDELLPRNLEQRFAYHLLMDSDIKFVSVSGTAGTGKDFTALLAGLDQLQAKNGYGRIVIAAAGVPLESKEKGFLPGNLTDKWMPFLQPLYENIDLLGKHNAFRSIDWTPKNQESLSQKLRNQNLLQVAPISHIRGYNYHDAFFIITEAQNLTRQATKTVATRIGENSKMVFTGDPYQIDAPHLTTRSCGLAHVVEKMKSEPRAAHIELRKGERSEAAEIASNLL